MSRRKRKKLPDPVEVRVEALSHEGRGIGRINGKAVFIDGALPGEVVRIAYTNTRARFDEARVEELIEASVDRAEPDCEFFPTCGGCSLQHMTPEFQLHHKESVLLEQLKNIGGVQAEKVMTPLTGNIWAYRHKARLSVKNVLKKGKVLVGFRERRKPYIADIDSCKILHTAVGEKITDLKLLLDTMEIKSSIPQIDVAVGDKHTTLVFRHMEDVGEADRERLRIFAINHNINICLQGNDQIVVLLDPAQGQAGLNYTLDEFGLCLDFGPNDFTQINFGINRKMVRRVIELLDLTGSEKVLDLFCGLGNFTLPIAKHSGHVTGIEAEEGLVQRASLNAANNHINNVKFEVSDLYKPDAVTAIASGIFNRVLIDPPRSGAREVVEAMDFRKTSSLVYVSCNPATLARDAGILVGDRGFTLTSTGIIDMFPHTTHVESIAVFEK